MRKCARLLAAQARHSAFILIRIFIPQHSRRRTDHLALSTYDADLARLRALLGLIWVCDVAHQRTTIIIVASVVYVYHHLVYAAHCTTILLVYKCCGVRRPFDGSHVNLHTGVPNIEVLHAGRWQRHDGTCERKEEEGEE